MYGAFVICFDIFRFYIRYFVRVYYVFPNGCFAYEIKKRKNNNSNKIKNFYEGIKNLRF